MNRSRKSLFFLAVTAIIVAMLFIRRFFPSDEGTLFDVTVRKSGSSVVVSAGANDVYVKSGDVKVPELRSRNETVYLNDDMIYTYSFRTLTPIMLTLPADTQVLEIMGNGDIYLSSVSAEILTVTSSQLIDADSLQCESASLKTSDAPISVSASRVGNLTLETKGGSVDVTGTESGTLNIKTLSGDILSEGYSENALLESSDGTITVYTDTPLRLKYEGALSSDEGTVSDEAERTLSVKTGSAVKILKGE